MIAAGVRRGLHLSAEEHPPGFLVEKAVEVMRALWTGDVVRADHGRHYAVEHARLFTLPDEPPPVVPASARRRSSSRAHRRRLHARRRPTPRASSASGPRAAPASRATEGILCSNDAQRHLDAIARYADAGFDHVIVQQCGSDQDRFIALHAEEVLPQLTAPTSRPPA